MLMLPLLTEDATRMDWVKARYSSHISINASSADIRIELDGAPELQRLLESSSASYVVDVRSPSALYVKTHFLNTPFSKIEFASEDVDIENLFVRTGVIAQTTLRLPTSGLSRDVWGVSDLEIPKGAFLAMGLWHASRTLAQSLLVFVRDSQLPMGTMGPVSPTGDQFKVPLAQALYDSGQDRSVWMAGLIAVFAYLGKNSPPEEEDTIVLSSIRSVLQDAGVPDWHDDEFDAARAATVLEQFEVSPAGGGDDDD